MKNRPGFVRTWGIREVAHRGIYDRHDECGGCLVSLYTMRLSVLTQRLIDWRASNETAWKNKEVSA